MLNRFRKFKKSLNCRSSPVQGATVDPVILPGSPGRSSRCFSRERPTKADLELWKSAIQTITSSSFKYSLALGPYLIERHNISPWYISNDKLELYKLHEDEAFEVYTCSVEVLIKPNVLGTVNLEIFLRSVWQH